MSDRTPAERIAELEATIEADRTRIIDAVNGLERVLNSRFWLTEGRGSYEWNDDRYREEFGDAARDILKALEPLRKIGADLTNCPQTTAEVIAARADKDRRIAELEARLAMLAEAVRKSECNCTILCDTRFEVAAALQASEKAVAAFIARVEARGAARAREAAMHFLGCVLAVRLQNQAEFMSGLADDINVLAEAMGEDDRAVFHGDGFRIVKAARAAELEGA